jgi:hypothetical protein
VRETTRLTMRMEVMKTEKDEELGVLLKEKKQLEQR